MEAHDGHGKIKYQLSSLDDKDLERNSDGCSDYIHEERVEAGYRTKVDFAIIKYAVDWSDFGAEEKRRRDCRDSKDEVEAYEEE